MPLTGTLLAKNAALVAAEPTEKIQAGENYGRVRRAYDEYVIPTGEELGIGAIVKMMTLPKGARLIDARWVGPDITAGAANVGWAASEEEAAQAAGLFAAAATGMNAAKDLKLAATALGFNKRFASETQLQAVVSTATDGGADEKVALEVFYVVD